MPWILAPQFADESVLDRLEDLRASYRRQLIFRNGSVWILVTLVGVLLACLLDWKFVLPGFVRALLLISLLTGSLLLFLRWLHWPLRAMSTPLAMANHVESFYPGLNDSLISAVQFLQMEPDSDRGSPDLREEAIQQAQTHLKQCDLDQTIEHTWLIRATLFAIGSVISCAYLLMTVPVAQTALQRLAFPYGDVSWPTRTQLEIVAPEFPLRMARGEQLDLKVRITGEIPDRLTLSLWSEAGTVSDLYFPLTQPETSKEEETLWIRVDSTRISNNFRLRLRANDAESKWYQVTVLPPPVLIPIDGRPSPWVHLDFPAYTDLAALDLPDGSSVIEAVSGTRITMKAATDRPVHKAWIAYKPEQPRYRISSMFSVLAADSALSCLSFDQLAREVWEEIPFQIDSSGTMLEGTFIPWLPGTYQFRFEDETGLGSNRLLEIRVLPDPAPLVLLERPAASTDSLDVVPDAEITLKANASDPLFALKSTFLEYRTQIQEAPQILILNDSEEANRWSMAVQLLLSSAVHPATQQRIDRKPIRWATERRLSLSQIRHVNGNPLKPGDRVFLQVAATDWDDVNYSKEPGRSHEVVLNIVSKQMIDAKLQETISQLRTELFQLKEQQRNARAQVQETQRQLSNNNSLKPEDQERLQQAEQTQQQIRGRINNPEDGLRKETRKLQQTIQDNNLPRSGTTDRLEQLANELQRLANEELDNIETAIAAARRSNETNTPPAETKKNLDRAQKHQKEVQDTLQSLLERLEPWGAAGEIRGEARSILGELLRNIEQMPNVPQGMQPNELNAEQRGELERAADKQDRLTEKNRQLLEKMNRLAHTREQMAAEREQQAKSKEQQAYQLRSKAIATKNDPDTTRSLNNQADSLQNEAENLREQANALKEEANALQRALRKEDATASKAVSGTASAMQPQTSSSPSAELNRQMNQASQHLRNNQLGQAKQSQQSAAENLQKMLETLEEKPQEDMDRLAKKLKKADADLEELIDQQDRLQKKMKEAQGITDPKQRQETLERLAKEQEQLERKTKELAQRLTRDRAEEAAQELRRATRQMEQAREQIENGNDAFEKQDEALDRLEDAQRELDNTKEEKEESLLREKITKMAEQIKGIRERQQRLLDETKRLHTSAIKGKKWTRPQAISFTDLKEQQSSLADELNDLIEKRFEDVPVFYRMLKQAQNGMEQAVKRINERRAEIIDQLEGITTFEVDLEEKAQKNILSRQQIALKRLDQLLDALKPDQQAMRQARQQQPPAKNAENSDNRESDSIPPLAELKALRSLQADIAERTAAFDQANPDRTQLTQEQVEELEWLQKAQTEIAELVQTLQTRMGN